jgi:hypothetical protein
MRLALRQRGLGHCRGGAQQREGERILHRQRGGGVHHLARQRAELVGQPRHPFRLDQVARLPDRRLRARRATLRQTGVPAMRFGQQGDDRARLAMRP